MKLCFCVYVWFFFKNFQLGKKKRSNEVLKKNPNQTPNKQKKPPSFSEILN